MFCIAIAISGNVGQIWRRVLNAVRTTQKNGKGKELNWLNFFFTQENLYGQETTFDTFTDFPHSDSVQQRNKEKSWRHF